MQNFTFLNAELERDADEEEIKVAYRRLAKFYHPDGLLLSFAWNFLNAWLRYYALCAL